MATSVTQISGSKQRAIDKSRKTMFIWVAGMSAVIGICAVISIFLVQNIMFKMEVVKQTKATADTLTNNNRVASELVNNVMVLNTNAALGRTKAYDDEEPLAVVLDALPQDNNPLALGSSLQQKLLGGIGGLSVDSIAVGTDASSDGASSATGDSSNTSGDDSTVPLMIGAKADTIDTVREVLQRLESSVRVVDIDSFTLESSNSSDSSSTGYTITISAHAYYQSGIGVQLTDKTIMPKGAKR